MAYERVMMWAAVVAGLALLPSCDLLKLDLGGSDKSASDDDDDDSEDDDEDAKKKKKKKKKRRAKSDDDDSPKPDETVKLPAAEPKAKEDWGDDLSPDKPSKTTTGDPQTDAWINIMRSQLPGEFCKPGSFFRTCFTIDEAECKRVAAAQFEPCLKKHLAQLPKIRSTQDGSRGGEILGRCAGSSFGESLEKQGKFTNTAKCRNPSAW